MGVVMAVEYMHLKRQLTVVRLRGKSIYLRSFSPRVSSCLCSLISDTPSLCLQAQEHAEISFGIEEEKNRRKRLLAAMDENLPVKADDAYRKQQLQQLTELAGWRSVPSHGEKQQE